MNRFSQASGIVLAVCALTACAGSGAGALGVPGTSGLAGMVRNGGSLGPVLTTSDGGLIFGFDIDQNGNDGMLASASQSEISVQTFDAGTGKIVKTIGAFTGKKVTKGDDYVADGIFAGDVGLVDFQKAGIPGKTATKDMYHLLDPVTKNKLNAKWSPSIALFNVLEWAPNQSTATSVLFGYQRMGSDPLDLIVSDIAQNTVSKVIPLSSTDFALGAQPQLAQDTVNNLAVMATSPSFGAAGGPPPVIFTFDLKTGKSTQFNGISCDDGSLGCGYANGIGYDSSTGMACTTTELDGGIEIYNVAKQTGIHEFLPGGGQFFAGAFVAGDPVNHLFLIAQPESSTGSGSSIQVYQENGTLLESIDGFNFTDAGDYVIPVRISIDPTKRTGWVNGPQGDQLQEFSY
jgi:hypothetical protein